MKRLPLFTASALLALGCSPPPPAPATPSPMPTLKCAPDEARAKAPAPDKQLAFDVLAMGGKKTGESLVTIHPDGTRAATMEWNDRGRGPKLQMNLALDASGAPRALDVVGVDYYKAAVDEHLALRGDKLAWKNRGEAGEGPSGTGAFYVAFHAPPEADAVLARALLKRPDHALPLLPKGQARLEKGTDVTLTKGSEKVHVTRWDFLGVDLAPAPIWLDDDGELFGEVSEWFAVVRAGWAEKVPELIADQTAAENTRLEKDTKALAHAPPAAGLAIVNARIFDAEKKTTQLGTILVKGDRIVAVGPAKAVKVPAGTETLDAAGKTVIPGLWDMHAHVSPLDGPLDVAAGVTTVRDLGNDVAVVKRLRDAWDSGKAVGPRVVAAGLIDGRGPYQAPTKVFADTEEEAKAQVDMYAAAGCVQLKIYSSIKPALVPALVAAAHARKMRVSGHVPSGMNATDAVNAGFDELQHMNFLFLNFLAKNDEDTRTPLRFTRVADKGNTIDPSQANVKAFIKLLAQKKIVVDATDNIFEAMFTDRAGKVPEWAARVEGRLPVLTRRGLLSGGLPLADDGADARYKESFAAVLKMTKALFDAGVPLVAGTDAFAGFALHRELELYAKAGIPAGDVLTLATLGAAKVMKKDKELGSITAGKYADLAIVDGKPDQDILDIEKVTTTIKGGVVFATKDVYATIGVGP
jgi:imidazolonepropionase-like amidohydrolase